MAGETILVVDDSIEACDFAVNYVLRPNGYRPLVAHDGEKGLRRAMDEALGTSAPAGPASHPVPDLVPSAPAVPAGIGEYALPRSGADDQKEPSAPAARVFPSSRPSKQQPTGARRGPAADRPSRSIRPLPTQLRATPPARHRNFFPVWR